MALALCRLASANEVTLVCEESHDHAGETKIDCHCVDVAMAGNITFVPGTKIKAIRGGSVKFEMPAGGDKREYDFILPMTRFEQEVPVETLGAFGLKYENRWNLKRLWTFLPILLIVAGFQSAPAAMTMQARCLRYEVMTTLRCSANVTVHELHAPYHIIRQLRAVEGPPVLLGTLSQSEHHSQAGDPRATALRSPRPQPNRGEH